MHPSHIDSVRKEVEEAAKNKDYSVISTLIKDNRGDTHVLKTIYSTAIDYGDLQIVNILIDHNVLLKYLSYLHPKSSIFTAYTKHEADFARELLLLGDCIKPDFIIEAIQTNNNTMLDFVLEYNTDKLIFQSAIINCFCKGTNDNIEVVEILFNYIDTENLENICKDPINIFMDCTLEMFMLLDSKINVKTPEVLELSAYNKDAAIVDYLLQMGVQPSPQTITTMLKFLVMNKDKSKAHERDDDECYPDPKWARAMFNSLKRNNIDLNSMIKRAPNKYLSKMEKRGVDLYAIINLLGC